MLNVKKSTDGVKKEKEIMPSLTNASNDNRQQRYVYKAVYKILYRCNNEREGS